MTNKTSPKSLAKSLVTLVVMVVGLSAATGCGTVAPYERGKLAHPTMAAADMTGFGEGAPARHQRGRGRRQRRHRQRLRLQLSRSVPGEGARSQERARALSPRRQKPSGPPYPEPLSLSVASCRFGPEGLPAGFVLRVFVQPAFDSIDP